MDSDLIAVARTPLRLSLGGGGTDLPYYADRFGGDLVTTAISLWVTVVARLGRIDGTYRYSHETTSVAATSEGLGNSYVAAALDVVGLNQPCEVVSMGPVPSGTGLGSSAAFTLSLLAALHCLRGRRPDPTDLAEQAFAIEAKRLGHPTGRQDHYACALGGVRRLVLDPGEPPQSAALAMPEAAKSELDRHLHLYYTGRRRDSHVNLTAPPDGAELDRRLGDLHRIKAVGDRIRTALQAGRINELSALMTEHWRIKARNGESQWDTHLMAARKAGAQAGKIVGAGGGGFLLVLAEPDVVPAVTAALADEGLRHVPFRFVTNGTTVECVPAVGMHTNGDQKEDLR